MKRIILILAVLSLAASCSDKNTISGPLADAIKAEAMKNADGPYTFKFTELNLIDSTTFIDEFKMRTAIFEHQLDQNADLLEKYLKEGKPKNAQKKFMAIKKAEHILNELDAMREQMGDDTLNIAYYDYCFSGEAKVGNKKMLIEKAYASVTPEFKVISVSGDTKTLHYSTGLVIPGYEALIKDNPNDEE